MAAATVLLGLTVGCSSPGEEAPATEPAPVTGETEVLTDFLCSADESGVWRGKATLNNVGSSANTYAVSFSVERSSDSTVVGESNDEFVLGAGESVDVTFPWIVTDRSSGLECVPRVTAQPAG